MRGSTAWQGSRSTSWFEFEGGILGMALNLEEDIVGTVILGDPMQVKEGNRSQDHGPHR